MTALLHFSRAIDGMSLVLGRILPWAVIIAVLVSAGNALSRKFFQVSSNAWLEAQLYLFGVIFLLPAGYTLLKNGHVRVDILASKLPRRVQLWIEILGVMFLMFPAVLLIVWYGIPNFLASFESGETSPNAGGLIRWPAKLLVPLGFGFLLLAGLSHLIKCLGFLMGRCPDPMQPAGPSEEEELMQELKAELDKADDEGRGDK